MIFCGTGGDKLMKIPAVIKFGEICSEELYTVIGIDKDDPDWAPKFGDDLCQTYEEGKCEPKCSPVPFRY